MHCWEGFVKFLIEKVFTHCRLADQHDPPCASVLKEAGEQVPVPVFEFIRVHVLLTFNARRESKKNRVDPDVGEHGNDDRAQGIAKLAKIPCKQTRPSCVPKKSAL